tara:strand:+ start:890 stop:1657 length:768 start_codon:yes stop_codon:yes gene_type:complete
MYEMLKLAFRYLYFGFLSKIFFCLKNHFSSNKLNELKDKYLGKKCFIICTGPSLRKQDLQKIVNSDFFTIGMNGGIKLCKELNFNYDFFLVQDIQVYEKIKKDFAEYDGKKIIGSTIFYKHRNINYDFYYFLDMLGHLGKKYALPYKTKFSKNSSKVVYDGYTVAYSAIQIACYLGFSEINIIGMDANYEKNISKRNLMNIEKVDPTYLTAGDRINYAMSIANNFCKKNGIGLYNCTRGGKLKALKRKNFDKILN